MINDVDDVMDDATRRRQKVHTHQNIISIMNNQRISIYKTYVQTLEMRSLS